MTIEMIEAPADKTALAIRSSIDQVETALTEFDKVSAGLDALRLKYSNVVFDVTSTKGMKEATEARAAIREPRYAVEKARKAAKAPVLALGKDIDARAAYITSALQELEEPIDQQIKAEEQRKAVEKAAREQAERERVERHQAGIERIRAYVVTAAGQSVEQIATLIRALEPMPVGADVFEEFATAAQRAKAETLERLVEMHAAAVAHEAEQARIAAEREELARLRAEQAERAASERARIAAEQKAEAERLAAERAAQEAELRRQREAQEAAMRAEREALERERAAARAAQEEAEREAARLRAEAARREQEALEAKERQQAEQRAREEAAREAMLAAEREAQRQRELAATRLQKAAPRLLAAAKVALARLEVMNIDVDDYDDFRELQAAVYEAEGA